MTTARERAREAVRHMHVEETDRYNECSLCDRKGDAASDVWEPLLQDLLKAYEHAVEYNGAGHHLDDSVFAWGGYTRAKEALGQ